MGKVFTNSGDPDQTPRSAVSDVGLHYLSITFLRVSRLQWVKQSQSQTKNKQRLNPVREVEFYLRYK